MTDPWANPGRAMRDLGDEWPLVAVSYLPGNDEPYRVKNVTDEGLPGDVERLEYRGETLGEALNEAWNEEVPNRP